MRALVGATSREEIEQAVCDRLADADPYCFAWVGRIDAENGTVEPTADAGVDDGYLDEVTITTDDDDPRGGGPAGTAIREQRACVAQDVANDPSFGPWRDRALERGFQSVVAVPLVYEGRVYGVLVVYATRADAFDETECDLLCELGSAIGHAIDVRQVRNRLERQYRNLFETAPVMYALTRDDGGTPVVVDCNQRFLDRLRYDREQIVGAPLANIYTAASADELLDEGGYSRALDGQFTQERRQLLTADGEIIETVLRAVPRYNRHGETVGTLTLFVDTETEEPGRALSAYRDVTDASNAK
jgi:PAS domain S-box-containing protein